MLPRVRYHEKYRDEFGNLHQVYTKQGLIFARIPPVYLTGAFLIYIIFFKK